MGASGLQLARVGKKSSSIQAEDIYKSLYQSDEKHLIYSETPTRANEISLNDHNGFNLYFFSDLIEGCCIGTRKKTNAVFALSPHHSLSLLTASHKD